MNLTDELYEELGAFDPKWKAHYSSVRAASNAAGVTDLFQRWLKTPDGKNYSAMIDGLPDHVGDSRREVEALRAPASLPYGYDNIGELPPDAWE